MDYPERMANRIRSNPFVLPCMVSTVHRPGPTTVRLSPEFWDKIDNDLLANKWVNSGNVPVCTCICVASNLEQVANNLEQDSETFSLKVDQMTKKRNLDFSKSQFLEYLL